MAFGIIDCHAAYTVCPQGIYAYEAKLSFSQSLFNLFIQFVLLFCTTLNAMTFVSGLLLLFRNNLNYTAYRGRQQIHRANPLLSVRYSQCAQLPTNVYFANVCALLIKHGIFCCQLNIVINRLKCAYRLYVLSYVVTYTSFAYMRKEVGMF